MAATELATMSLFSDANLQAYWRFSTGSELTDSIGSVVMVTGTNATTISGGKFDFGYDYDGASVNSYTQINYSADFSAANMKTISFWLKINSLPSGTDFILDSSETNSGATNFVRLALSSTGVLNHRVVGPTTAFIPQDSNALATATWYHVAITHNNSGSNVIMYIDGTPTGLGTAITETIGTNSTSLYIGRLSKEHGGTGFEPDISVDDFAVFDRALTAQEIYDIAQGRERNLSLMNL